MIANKYDPDTKLGLYKKIMDFLIPRSYKDLPTPSFFMYMKSFYMMTIGKITHPKESLLYQQVWDVANNTNDEEFDDFINEHLITSIFRL